MQKFPHENFVTLDSAGPVWDRFFTVAPLVVVGTKEGDGYDLAPKHMAMPLGWEDYFGFVCTPRHATYHNAIQDGAFTVSFPKPTQIVLASLTASPRCDSKKHDGNKAIISALPTIPAQTIDGIFLKDAYLFLECELDRVIDEFGDYSLLVGRVVATHVLKEAMRVTEVDDQEVVRNEPLLAYLCPGRYATVEESFSFPLPAGIQF